MYNNLFPSIGYSELFESKEKKFGFNDSFSNQDEHISSKIVLLQGPVGPFFRNLRRLLERRDFNAWRICFNAADNFYSDRKNRINFSGNLVDWCEWFRDFVAYFQPDMIIFFGSEREIHRAAKDIADEIGIKVLSLEEGYIRPGFVTVEEGGNNAQSRLAGTMPPQDYVCIAQDRSEPHDFKGLVSMCFFGAIYYIIRSVFSYGAQKRTFHRQISLISEAYCWIRNFSRRFRSQSTNSSTIQKLIEFHDKKYILIPLQVASDGQLGRNALQWNSTRLIAASMKSFAESASRECRLVFKIHPMERGHCNHEKFILDTAAAFEVSDRIDIISVGSLGLLARHAARMITINSTAGLSAVFHGTPLMVIGKALYAHEDLATCAMGSPDFKTFWSVGRVAERDIRKSYLAWIKDQALVEGDFYASLGIEIGCSNILRRVEDLLGSSCAVQEKRTVS